ncbi:alpha/beta fold hydrolase [Chryseobacterium sp.]|uniref:thioesterase II family protein n=1 Tax=Chryseobacterium sp. TaxID=1871047 RepID=UPI0025BF7AA5|nr:alpha/beta fold hydrolase [Chryseobacterium sp.]
MFPFAGGNAYSYRGLIEPLEEYYDIVCTELPGRNNSSQYPLDNNLDNLVDFVFKKWIQPVNLERPYILYGHSMGGIMLNLIARKIMENERVEPSYLIVSGCAAPSVRRDQDLYKLSSFGFWKELEKKGGVPDYILENEEYKDYLEPILRNDFEAIETYNYKENRPVNVDMTVMYGTEESLDQESLVKWQDETTGELEILSFPGDHFFLFKNKPVIIEHLKNKAENISQLI